MEMGLFRNCVAVGVEDGGGVIGGAIKMVVAVVQFDGGVGNGDGVMSKMLK